MSSENDVGEDYNSFYAHKKLSVISLYNPSGIMPALKAFLIYIPV